MSPTMEQIPASAPRSLSEGRSKAEVGDKRSPRQQQTHSKHMRHDRFFSTSLMSNKEEQIGFDFGEAQLEGVTEERLEDAFRGFHKVHPEVWRRFNLETLKAVEEGRVPLRPHDIMAIVRRKTSIPVDYRYIPLYASMFTSNHQELEWIFR